MWHLNEKIWLLFDLPDEAVSLFFELLCFRKRKRADQMKVSGIPWNASKNLTPNLQNIWTMLLSAEWLRCTICVLLIANCVVKNRCGGTCLWGNSIIFLVDIRCVFDHVVERRQGTIVSGLYGDWMLISTMERGSAKTGHGRLGQLLDTMGRWRSHCRREINIHTHIASYFSLSQQRFFVKTSFSTVFLSLEIERKQCLRQPFFHFPILTQKQSTPHESSQIVMYLHETKKMFKRQRNDKKGLPTASWSLLYNQDECELLNYENLCFSTTSFIRKKTWDGDESNVNEINFVGEWSDVMSIGKQSMHIITYNNLHDFTSWSMRTPRVVVSKLAIIFLWSSFSSEVTILTMEWHLKSTWPN